MTLLHPIRMALLRSRPKGCLLYTSDAADERSSVDLGGRRIIKKKNKKNRYGRWILRETRQRTDKKQQFYME